MLWFIRPDELRQMAAVQRAGVFKVTPEDVEAFEARIAQEREQRRAEAATPRNLIVAGSEAEILIEGPLVKRSMFMFFLFSRGQTVYQDIIDALAAAEQDPAIKRVTLKIDSPGGTVDGFFDTLAALQAFSKPLVAKVINAHSAAFGIAAMASRIEATSPASRIGSVGVATSYFFFGDEEIIDLTNTESPDKRPDVRTEEGKAVVVRELDALAELMADAIAQGRTKAGAKVKASEVFEKFGRGASFVAAEAKRREMIDAAPAKLRVVRAEDENEPEATPPQEGAPAASGNPAEGGKEPAMADEEIKDVKALRRKYPDLCEELLEQGHEKGASEERVRVNAHLTYGKGAGEQGMTIALKAIEEGTDVNAAVIAKYMTAARNESDASARGEDSRDAAGTVAGAAQPTASGNAEGSAQDMGDLVVKKLEEQGVRGFDKQAS